MKKVNVLIIHFRSAPAPDWKQHNSEGGQDQADSRGTDGVSLEMKKRRHLLEEMGHKVAICSAYDWAEYPLPALEFDSDETRKLMNNMYQAMNDFTDVRALEEEFNKSVAHLELGFTRIIENFSPDTIFVHNILCLPIHPAATVALINALNKTKIPYIAIHHDILSEGAYKFKPQSDFAEKILKECFPPVMPNITHWTINTRNQTALKKKGIEAKIIHDTMDFNEKLNDTDYNKLRSEIRSRTNIANSDVVLFMGARIVPNKQIEIAGQLTAKLESLKDRLMNQSLYNGEKFTEKSEVTMVIAGRPEAGFVEYKQNLFNYLDSLNISWKYIGDIVRPVRSEEEGHYALYPDMYTMADFILYPTGWEGFGNQLLEAFAAGLPAAVFEYPVFKEDIGPKGVQIVSLGDKTVETANGLVQVDDEVINNAAEEMLDILGSPGKYNQISANNYEIGKRYFGFDVQRAHLKASLEWASLISESF
ncbi:MAG: glycosyltransferase family 4 protein [Bacteroidales bacterium]|nr:glycosyltransferase family 4 protein [Bacteroidales bacterium]